MTDHSRNTALGGGFFLLLAPLVGFLIGRSMGETSLGLMIGIGAGIAIAVLANLFLRR